MDPNPYKAPESSPDRWRATPRKRSLLLFTLVVAALAGGVFCCVMLYGQFAFR